MESESRWVPTTALELHLPPSFITEHAIRTLSFQGAMTASELARHWRVRDNIAIEVVASLKTAGLVGLDSSQSTFERTGRVHLMSSGLARVEAARQRTRYAGPLPVALSDFESRTDIADGQPIDRTMLERALTGESIPAEAAAEIGQAIASDSTVAIAGLAFDEQSQIASALASALTGEVTLPYALYAAGSVVRVFDVRYHHSTEDQPPGASSDGEVLRARGDFAQWGTIERPFVRFAGGVHESDILPAYDEESRFYVAPAPFAACGGLMTVMDAGSNPAALRHLAQLWLIPGLSRTGIILLRSGERIEVPWRTATVLFGDVRAALPGTMREALLYSVDLSALRGDALRSFVGRRLARSGPAVADAVEAIASLIERRRLTTRSAAALATRYVSDRAAYEGDQFQLTASLLEASVEFASERQSETGPALRAAS